MKDFGHYNAKTVKEAVRLLGKEKGKARINAGGTDLLGMLKDMVTPDYPATIVNIKGIGGLEYIREEKDGLKIGALTRLAAIADSQVVSEGYGLIAEAAKSVATPQIRNMCTIGGNLAQEVRCWYYRYPDQLGGTIMCLRKGGAVCNAVIGDNRYHSIFGGAGLASYPCSSACPAGTGIPSYLEKVRKGEFDEAGRMFVEFNPMPAVTGRVCPTFCEPECKRGGHDEPVAIRCVERALGDHMLEHAARIYKAPDSESGKKIAIVGSGPSGLTAAYYLRRAGHSVTVYEKLPEVGGMLSYSIPGYRLPKDVVRRQVKALEGMGTVFQVGVSVGKDLTVEALSRRFDKVLFATGAWKEKVQSMKGAAPVLSGLQFLKAINGGDRTIPGKKVAVIGGGNVAIDVARTLARLGSKPVVLYRRTLKEMPAFKDEVEKATEEGVLFRFLTLPTRAEKAGGKIGLTCVRMQLGAKDESGRRSPFPKEGSEFTAVYDAVIRATGEEPDPAILPSGLRKKAAGHFLGENIYGAGDFMNGSSTVIEAVASGREAADEINRSLGIAAVTEQSSRSMHGFVDANYQAAPRLIASDIPVPERLADIALEDRPGSDATGAMKEAGRCFNCGCVAINPSDIGAALVALGGTIATTKRVIDSEAFFAPDATRPTVLDADEMITEIRIPRAVKGMSQHYLKFTLRKPIDFAIVSVATAIGAKDGVCTDARIVLSAVAPTPFRSAASERTLLGKKITDQAATEAAQAAVEGAKSLEKNGYKVQILRALVKRAILGESA